MGKINYGRLKLLLLLLFTIFILFIKNWQLLVGILVFFLIIVNFIDKKNKIKERLSALFLIGILVVIFQLIFNHSIEIRARITGGILSAAKIATLSILAFTFTSFTSFNEIIDIFSFLPKQFQLMLTITFSFIPIVLEESKKIFLAQNSRGYHASLINPFKSFLPLIIPLLHRVLRRAEQISLVIYSRGYYDE